MRQHRPTRRSVLAGAAGAALAAGFPAPRRASAQSLLNSIRGSIDATHEGLVPGAADDQSILFRRAVAAAGQSGRTLFLPPGRYRIAEIDLPSRISIAGVPGETHLIYSGGAYLMRAAHAERSRLSGLAMDGRSLPLENHAQALFEAEDVTDLTIEDCAFLDSSAGGIALTGCAGRVNAARIGNSRTIGCNLMNSRGMTVSGNSVTDCGDSGIVVQRKDAGPDDTIVRGNRVTRIRNDSGGTGQYGNGINLAQANGVIVADNRIDDCAFSAVRCFSSDNIQVSGNIATNSGEMAIYVEFAFQGAIVTGNLVDGAAFGISFANFLEFGGRLAVCANNLVRNISGVSRFPRGEDPLIGCGIGAEADIAITGNVIENAQQGLELGWGEYLRDVAATGNIIRDSRIGIGATVVEGAGQALIAHNLISGAELAIVGKRWLEVATDDLAISGAEAHPHLTIEGNRTS